MMNIYFFKHIGGGEKIGLISGLFKVAAVGVGVAVLGPLALTVLTAGNMDGIDD
jgi:hypothetical protein